MTNRRMDVWVILISALMTVGCSSLRGRQTAEFPQNLPVIDAHLHTHFTGNVEKGSGIADTRESLLQEMAANGVVGGVALMAEGEREYADLSAHGIIHCAGIRDKFDMAQLESSLNNGRAKCFKIYLGYAYRYAYDKRYEPIYRLAAKYGVPVIFHTGDTLTKDGLLKYSDPMTIDEVAVKHRQVTFVIAHLGNPWVQTAAEVAYKNPNVYIDVSALLIGDLTKADDHDIEEYVVKPIRWAFGYCEDPRKLMFGTDWPLTNMKSYIAAVKRAIPPQHWVDVFHNNAVRVFKIPGRQILSN